MKSMLITVSAVGVVIAGLILYFQKKNQRENRLLDAGNNSDPALNDGMERLERPALHAMG